MPRISATLDTETFNKIKTNSKSKKKTVSEYIRELIEIGLKIEEISTQNEANNGVSKNEFDMDDMIKTILKISLRCGVESLSLIRCLVDGLLPEKSTEYLSIAKQKSEIYVEGLLKERI